LAQKIGVRITGSEPAQFATALTFATGQTILHPSQPVIPQVAPPEFVMVNGKPWDQWYVGVNTLPGRGLGRVSVSSAVRVAAAPKSPRRSFLGKLAHWLHLVK
jgi:hypothetical protein